MPYLGVTVTHTQVPHDIRSNGKQTLARITVKTDSRGIHGNANTLNAEFADKRQEVFRTTPIFICLPWRQQLVLIETGIISPVMLSIVLR